ncbi:MAG TPA: translesion DNA synthesis-associated protein ImuA [Steroidobacteraceae bacterium]|nr:translesion DNA synthesis-associated protein ImuA [Steroidobacteraceae bacterium]
MVADPRLAPLLNHPAIWRGASAAQLSAVSTGFPALDARLPGRGWPQTGLVEMLIPRLGIGELYLILPALALLGRRPEARWCAWITPQAKSSRPFPPCGSLELNAPALVAHGVRLSQVLVIHADLPLWACEQALRSGACDVVLTWTQRVQPRASRRLQLATERGRTLAFLFRAFSARALQEPSPAALRLAVQPASEGGVRLTVLKSRGGSRGEVAVHFDSSAMSAREDAPR